MTYWHSGINENKQTKSNCITTYRATWENLTNKKRIQVSKTIFCMSSFNRNLKRIIDYDNG